MTAGALHLLQLDPALGTDLLERFDEADRTLTVRGLELAPGIWHDARWELENTDLGVLILDGWIAREVQLARRISCDLAGPGDVLQAPAGAEDSLLPVTLEWSAVTRVRAAIIDVAQVQPWPEVQRQLLARIAGHSQRLAFEHAIVALPGIEARIVAYFTHMAAYWGRVTNDGIIVGPPLSHDRLAQLIGSRRPTVTTALGRLQEDGAIARHPDGRWMLRPGEQVPRATATHGRRAQRPVPPAPVLTVAPPSGTASALRFQALAARLDALDAQREDQLNELIARTSSLRKGAAEMQARTQVMRTGPAPKADPDVSGPPSDASEDTP